MTGSKNADGTGCKTGAVGGAGDIDGKAFAAAVFCAVCIPCGKADCGSADFTAFNNVTIRLPSVFCVASPARKDTF